MFKKEKKDFLIKTDKSKKGKIDKRILSTLKLINSSPNYYTTSSCSGRIVLLKKFSSKKDEIEWLSVKHDKVSYEEILKCLNLLSKEDIWFKLEPFIMHICCKDLNYAKSMLSLSRKIFKKSGVIAINRKIILEITGTEKIETILANKGKLLISKNYLRFLVKEANRKLITNFNKIEKFNKLSKTTLHRRVA